MGVQISPWAPKQNLTAFSKPEGGTRFARPTDFPPIFPNEFRIFGALARTVFSPRSRCEPKISLAQTFFAKKERENNVSRIRGTLQLDTDNKI